MMWAEMDRPIIHRPVPARKLKLRGYRPGASPPHVCREHLETLLLICSAYASERYIADALSMPESTVHKMLARARARKRLS